MPEAKVVFYREDDDVPVLDWLDKLSKKAKAKCIVRINRLAELGHELRRPEADYLRDGIYELRIGLQGINYRILYSFHDESIAVLTHGLTKEKRVPSKDIDLAIERKKRFEEDPEGYSY